MKVVLRNISKEESGKVNFGVGSIKLSVSKRSTLLKGLNLKRGNTFELTLTKKK
jgi:hypothetical protein